jgi:hypothetical protein
VALTVVVRSVEGDAAPSITLDAPRIVIGRGDGWCRQCEQSGGKKEHANLLSPRDLPPLA